MKITTEDLADRIQGELRGRGDVELFDVAPLDTATPIQVSYVESPKQLRKVKSTTAGALLVNSQLADQISTDRFPLLVVNDPQGAFIQTMLLFRPPAAREATGLSPQAFIDPSALFGEDTNVHPGASIGKNVVIGKNCDILSGAVIREGAVLGDHCTIHPQAVLYPGVKLGRRVIIHANAVIGADGFGYRFLNGRFERLPHTGTVIIEDDVEVGACATIDRGMIGPTVIGTGTKIDNLVMIAHNCQIGKHNAFASQVGFAGSSSTGDYVRCGGQAGVADHVRLGHQVVLGGKAAVMADLPDPGTYHGIPARPEKDALKQHLGLTQLPKMREQVQQLTAQLAQLQQQLDELTGSSRPAKAA